MFVDIEPDTCNIDAALIEAAITPRTRAIMPVSLYGQVADMDAHQRHRRAPRPAGDRGRGAELRRQLPGPAQLRPVSTFGCTSFFPSKPLGCYGDGGALFTDDDALAQAAREIRVHGQSARYTHTRVGVGGRMDTLQCAVVLAKLERFDWELQRRAELGARYARLLAGVPRLQLLAVRARPRLRLGASTPCSCRRPRAGAGGAAGRGHAHGRALPQAAAPPAGLCARMLPGACCPVSERAAERVLSLPMSADLTRGRPGPRGRRAAQAWRWTSTAGAAAA